MDHSAEKSGAKAKPVEDAEWWKSPNEELATVTTQANALKKKDDMAEARTALTDTLKKLKEDGRAIAGGGEDHCQGEAGACRPE